MVILQLPHRLVGAHPRVKLAAHQRRLAAHAAAHSAARHAAGDVPLCRAGRQLEREGELAQLLRPAVSVAHRAVADHLLPLCRLRLLCPFDRPKHGELLLRCDYVVRLGVVIVNLDDPRLLRREHLLLVPPKRVTQLAALLHAQARPLRSRHGRRLAAHEDGHREGGVEQAAERLLRHAGGGAELTQLKDLARIEHGPDHQGAERQKNYADWNL